MSASRDLSPTITAATPIEALPAHTPGPWVAKQALRPIDGEFDYGVGPQLASGRVQIVAEAFGICSEGRLPVEANARLIAAAPDLLEAANTLCSKYRARDFPTYMFDDWRALEAAIAKATGQGEVS